MPISTAGLANMSAACVTVDSSQVVSGVAGSHLVFRAHVATKGSDVDILAQSPIILEDTNENACEPWCSVDDLVGNCAWCKCASCPRCAIEAVASNCQILGKLTDCWGVKMGTAVEYGPTRLRFANSTSRSFGCSVELPRGAQPATTKLQCAEKLPSANLDGVVSAVNDGLSTSPLPSMPACPFGVRMELVRSRAGMQVLHAMPARWFAGAELLLNWPEEKSKSHVTLRSIWGAEVDTKASMAVHPRDGFRVRLRDVHRTFFALEFEGNISVPPRVSCLFLQRKCGTVSLDYRAEALPLGPGNEAFGGMVLQRRNNSAHVHITPWASGALLKLGYRNSVLPPRVSRVHGGLEASPATLNELAFRLDTVEPPNHVLVFETAGDDDTHELAPDTITCESPHDESSTLLNEAPQPRAEDDGADCDDVAERALNIRLASKPKWCDDLRRVDCHQYFYQITPQWLVECVPAQTDEGRCTAASATLSCGLAAPPPPPVLPPAWIMWERECSHLLSPPRVDAITSSSYSIRPMLSTVTPVPRCEEGLNLLVEYSRDRSSWFGARISEQTGSAMLVVDDLNCGNGETEWCVFRVRPRGWSVSSQPSVAIGGRPLPPLGSAARIQLTFSLGRTASVCLTCPQGRQRLSLDIANVLSLPAASFVRIVEVRGSRDEVEVVMDLVGGKGRSSSMLVEQLESLLLRKRSPLFGGDVTQFVNASKGLVRVGGIVVEARGSLIPLFALSVVLLATGLLCALMRITDLRQWMQSAASVPWPFAISRRMGRGMKHVKLSTSEDLPSESDVEEEADDMNDTSFGVDPLEVCPPSLPDLRTQSHGEPNGREDVRLATLHAPAAEEEAIAQSIVDQEPNHLHVQAMHPQPTPSDQDLLPVALGVSPFFAGHVMNCEMEYAEPIVTQSVVSEQDGSRLLRF